MWSQLILLVQYSYIKFATYKTVQALQFYRVQEPCVTVWIQTKEFHVHGMNFEHFHLDWPDPPV